MRKARKSERLLPWFGSNSENAADAGVMLRGCRWVGIPFGGGMSEVPYIEARQILVNDRHRHVINLCCVLQDDAKRQWLIEQADAMPYHPDMLATLSPYVCLSGPRTDRLSGPGLLQRHRDDWPDRKILGAPLHRD